MNAISHAIDKELKTLILNTANDNHAPILGVVSSVSDDGQYIDVNLARGGTLPAVKVFSGTAKIGAETLLIFVDGDTAMPLAFIRDVPVHKPYYNVFYNGNFGVINGNQFENWQGGKLCTETLYGSQGCEIEIGASLISNLFDISTIQNEAFTVSFVWKGGGFTLEVLDQDNNILSAVPSVLGNIQTMAEVSDWSYQRFNYLKGDISSVKIRFVNNDTKPTFIDGVRVWKPDDYQEWFPNKDDV